MSQYYNDTILRGNMQFKENLPEVHPGTKKEGFKPFLFVRSRNPRPFLFTGSKVVANLVFPMVLRIVQFLVGQMDELVIALAVMLADPC